MAATLAELKANITAATAPGYRDKLLASGQARGMIWREGELPEDAPTFRSNLSGHLLSFGYSLLLHGLRYLDLKGDQPTARVAFEVAAEALEAVVARGEKGVERDFHRLMAAAAYHLARFSARAYSLLHVGLAEANLSVIERCLAKLILRDLEGVNADVTTWYASGDGSDEVLIGVLGNTSQKGEDGEDAESATERVLEVMTRALEGNFMAASSETLLAFERGDEKLIEAARARFKEGLAVAGELNLVSQWWAHRVAVHIIDGLWDNSFHVVLPAPDTENTGGASWQTLRKIFIASVTRRKRAEVELWPSQIEAAKKVLDVHTNLVLSLPTSAGKTRIAELCVLACLARGKRAVFVTPLRALSAQTEVTLRRTFGPLGKTVSSLYGSIGASGADVDALRSQDIVVATPEKLDFALRSAPELLDDIGLVVLDEGHMIGLGEREVRYEAQIQRLLRRSDAAARRIVCLSAILPDGDQLEDFSAWLTSDEAEGLIKNDWRPTRLRYGEVDWNSETSTAQLNIVVGDEHPFVPRFVSGKTLTSRKNAKVYPSDQTELCVFTAWRLMDEGQSVLVFCPLRVSVIPFAKRIIKMHSSGLISSVLECPLSALSTALAVGSEWFGPDHEILKCLKMGVAVHHGELPTPFRKEVEKLLRDGALRLTVSSPTLAQGLNLSASSLIFHGHFRDGETIKVSEFRNVVGRAGRAYVDIEGLVLYPMFDEHAKRREAWAELCTSSKGREMESGLLRLLVTLIGRMVKKLRVTNVQALLEYVAGQAAWEFPVLPGEKKRDAEAAQAEWPRHLAYLDTAIFSLLGDSQVPDDQLEIRLDEVLQSSLLMRRLERHSEANRAVLLGGLKARARHIWSRTTAAQRRGYFLAGVGLATGQALDEKSEVLERLLLQANIAVDVGNKELAIQSVVEFAEIAFQIPPFTPKRLPEEWKEVLERWLSGVPLPDIGVEDLDEAVSLIEHAFVYNLPWAMEAIRVRAEAHEDPMEDDLTLASYEGARAVLAVETGTVSVPAAILIGAGFTSRLGAIEAVKRTNAKFDSSKTMRAWLVSKEVQDLAGRPDWPTVESHELWLEFTQPSRVAHEQKWSVKELRLGIKWRGAPMPPGRPLRIGGGPGRGRTVYTASFEEVGVLDANINEHASGLAVATATGEADKIFVEYIGPADFLAANAKGTGS